MLNECEDVDQQPRSGEETPGEHAGGSALSVHGVQEEISSSQRGTYADIYVWTPNIYTQCVHRCVYAYKIHLYLRVHLYRYTYLYVYDTCTSTVIDSYGLNLTECTYMHMKNYIKYIICI